MCQLLGLNCNHPTDATFSFSGFTRRAGITDHHSDGWAIAFFEGQPEARGLRHWVDHLPASSSPVAELLSRYPIKSRNLIAHIRKATQGVVALENCHPFHRSWHGQDWVFAHNGDIKGEIPAGNTYRPVGNTDSEAAFCWILNTLDGLDPAPEALSPCASSDLFGLLNRCSTHLAGQGIFNCLISNGHWLYAFGGTKLHVITRRAPFTMATLADDDLTVDFSELTTEHDVVTIVSTEPLTTNEQWRALAPGESLLLVDGEIVEQAVA